MLLAPSSHVVVVIVKRPAILLGARILVICPQKGVRVGIHGEAMPVRVEDQSLGLGGWTEANRSVEAPQRIGGEVRIVQQGRYLKQGGALDMGCRLLAGREGW